MKKQPIQNLKKRIKSKRESPFGAAPFHLNKWGKDLYESIKDWK